MKLFSAVAAVAWDHETRIKENHENVLPLVRRGDPV